MDREYTVHISRDGKPTINEVSYTSPVTFKGGLVTVGLNGIFFEDVKVYAVPISGGAKIEGKQFHLKINQQQQLLIFLLTTILKVSRNTELNLL